MNKKSTVSDQNGIQSKPRNEGLVIVAAGASAGGLEAIKLFLHSFPVRLNNIAVIIAQHLSPTHKSMMVQLLVRDSEMRVIEAKSGTTIVAKTVYITPPDKQIVVENGKIKLRKIESAIGPKPSIDTFFTSLAKSMTGPIVGVILSGTGSDGSIGIQALKKAGGFIIIQDPDTAKYDGMPRSAIQTGAYDAILAPDQIGNRIAAHLTGKNEFDEDIIINDLDLIFQRLSERTGTDFSHYKRATINRRLRKRMDSLKIKTITEYNTYLEDNPEEADIMFQTILIGVTSFFRDKEAFESLKSLLEDQLKKFTSADTFRVWIPGCSTGAEPYSIAIMLQELSNVQEDVPKIQIFASDIDEEAIKFARAGVYEEDMLHEVDPKLISEYFNAMPDRKWELNKSTRSMVLFSKHDLTKSAPFLKINLISCRNLLIYFDESLKRQIMPLFHYSLSENGTLFLGKSETTGSFDTLFSAADSKNKIYKRKAGQSKYPVRLLQNTATKSSTHSEISSPAKPSLSILVRDTLFRTFEHPYVVIDQYYSIVETKGDVRLFLTLPDGSMSNNLMVMLNKELQIEGRKTISESIKEHVVVHGKIRKFELYGTTHFVRITVKPIAFEEKAESLFVVIFEKLDITEFLKKSSSLNTELVSDRIEELEHELTITKELMQTYIEEVETSNEELQSLNEELQSSNEELQSTNEELETTNEELQSTNEEIQIAYEELEMSKRELEGTEHNLRIRELNQRAMLGNTLQGFILVDGNFKVAEINEVAKTILSKIHPHSIGKGDTMYKLGIDSQSGLLLKELRRAFEGKDVRGEMKYETNDGEILWLAYNFMPVIDTDSNYSTVSAGILDITDQKRFSEQLNQTERLLQSVFNSTSTGICITDSNGRYVDVNTAYCEIYGYTKEELVHKHFTIVAPDEYKSVLIKLHDDFIAGKEELDAEWIVQRKDMSRIDIFASAHLLEYADGSRYKVTSIRDITENKKYKNFMSEAQQRVQIGGWELDTFTRILSWSEETYKLMGISFEEHVDLEYMIDLFPDEAGVALESAIEQALDDGTPFDIELELNPDMNRNWIRISCKPVRVYDKTIKLFGTIQNVSDRINQEVALRSSLLEKEVLLAEIHHRVKNNLAVVSSMLQLQMMDESDEKLQQKLFDSTSRVATMAAIHEDLYKTKDFANIPFDSLIQKLLIRINSLQLSKKKIDIQYDLTDFKLNMQYAIPCALTLNEVVTNIFKHAFEGRDGGLICVKSEKIRSTIKFEITDNGIGIPDRPLLQEAESLGMQLIGTLTQQLEGKSTYMRREDGGTRFTLEFRVKVE
ncbi:MAG: PAS domain S-box protein [Balneolales bacterium]|nr:PAS domain S-box protein [Balneolales bacterium]